MKKSNVDKLLSVSSDSIVMEYKDLRAVKYLEILRFFVIGCHWAGWVGATPRDVRHEGRGARVRSPASPRTVVVVPGLAGQQPRGH